MDLSYSAEDLAFRDEVRSFIRDNLPAHIRDKVAAQQHLAKDDYVTWQKILHGRGWMAPHWPKEWGGCDWSPVQRHIFDEELNFGNTPRIMPFGTKMLAPVLLKFGTEAQKQRFLPRILSSQDWWCQGYSEPGAGSDLAGLKTRAERRGDHYVVTGQKTWTTLAQYADWMFVLVRTDPAAKKQEGISFLLMDMRAKGVAVRPIRTIDGSAEINDVFLDGVEVPVENLVGEENKGWTCAKYLLGHERSGIAGIAHSKKMLEKLRRVAAEETIGGRPLIEHGPFRDKIARIEIELMALEYTNLRALANETKGVVPGPEPSILKVRGTEIQQAITELFVEAAGPYALPFLPEALEGGANVEPVGPEGAAAFAPTYLNWRKTSIYGGSNEIQKNIVSKILLRA
ncbi:acyl-CoA dehydrogenase family protein [Stella sp.]|uniref:acyl-CoA dehydrogenase family protein n=1 Tax=Stella sp. TaxID=2912054 RepID=UPI0035B4AA83